MTVVFNLMLLAVTSRTLQPRVLFTARSLVFADKPVALVTESIDINASEVAAHETRLSLSVASSRSDITNMSPFKLHFPLM